jgi:hypothetical protein
VKAFAILGAAVLLVVGIGVGIVGGLRTIASSVAAKQSSVRTYSLEGVKFSVAVPGQLRLEPSSLFRLGDGVGGVGDGARLAVTVQMLDVTAQVAVAARW